MPTIKTIDPVTRLEGHLKIDVTIDTVGGVQQVVEAKATGTLFRGFEKILAGRDPLDAPHITQRVCGVCPVSHGMAAVLALDAAAKTPAPNNARILRNLVLGANFIQSHILHFYHLALVDFVKGPDMPPWQPSWQSDRRITGATATALVNNYVAALDMRRKAHEMGAIFGGRLPHPPTFVPGGITAVPKATTIALFTKYLAELTLFIKNVYTPDVEKVAAAYPDFAKIGRGYGNLIAYGVFDQNATGTTKLMKSGVAVNASTTVGSLNLASITESISYSWYSDLENNLNPSVGSTTPVCPKGDAYSWLKAPRYAGVPYEAGPLARMWVNGDYRRGVSVMDRHRARAAEALKVATAMATWLKQLTVGATVYTQYAVPTKATGVGLTEAPRGALGHWVNISGGRIANYQIITPTCWNASPKDATRKRGPVEQALIGTPIKNIDEPVEVLRVIHSFDPCLSCAVHVLRPGETGAVHVVEMSHAG